MITFPQLSLWRPAPRATDPPLGAKDLVVLVGFTGITGFIGGHLAERLLAEGQQVRGLARRPDDAAWLADKAPK